MTLQQPGTYLGQRRSGADTATVARYFAVKDSIENDSHRFHHAAAATAPVAAGASARTAEITWVTSASDISGNSGNVSARR